MKPVLSILSLLLVLSVSEAQNQNNPTGLEQPNTWSIDLGAARNYATRKNLFYYKITYKGEAIREGGSQLSPASFGTGFSAPKVAGDSDQFRFDLVDGVGSLTSPLFESLGLKPLEFVGIRGLRGAVHVAGQAADGKQINIGVGLETKPFTPLRNANFDLTNNVRFGILGERSGTGTGAKDTWLLTYRALVGTGFNYVKSDMTLKLQDATKKRLETLSVDEARKLKDGPADDPLVQIANLVDFDDSSWLETFKTGVDQYFSVRFDQPSLAFEFTAEGSYAPEKFDTRRYTSLFAINLHWWPTPTKPEKGSLIFTYQHGHNRAAPTESLTGLILAFGLRF